MKGIHVALKLHGDLEHCTPMNGFEVSEDNALRCVPESVYMFLWVVLEGASALEESSEADTMNKLVLSLENMDTKAYWSWKNCPSRNKVKGIGHTSP